MRRSGAPLSLWMAQVELPLAILAMDAEAAHVARFAAQAVRLTALALRGGRRVGRRELARTAWRFGWSREERVMAAWVLALNGVQAGVKVRGTVLWCGALARRCPFNWDGRAEGAWFAAYVRAYCPAGRYEPRGRSAVCAWARRAQDV